MRFFLIIAMMFMILPSIVLAQAQIDPEWVYRWYYSTGESESGDAIACDQLGNVYATGHSDTLNPHDDWVTLKLNSAGDSMWVDFYDSPLDGIDTPGYIAVDDSGNVYVCGDCGASSFDWEMNAVTAKYDPLGNRLWIHDYNGPYSLDENTENFGLDNDGYPVVVGYTEIPGGKEYLTIKLRPDGDTAWVRTMSTGNGTFDRLYGVAFDDSNNIYVTGGNSLSGSNDIAIIKYTPGGDTLWMRIYDGVSGGDEQPYGIGIDDSGYVYVGGYTTNANRDFLAIKYDSDGNFIWDFVYDGAGHAADNIRDAVVDGAGNVYMIGETTENSQRDILLTKTDNTGTLEWDFQYDAGGNANELVFNSKNLLNVDGEGHIYFGAATYYIAAGATNSNTLTFKLCPDGTIDWYGRYGGPGIDFDQIKAVTLDDENNCYVTGYSTGVYGNWDLFVLKYPDTTVTGCISGCDYEVGDVNGSANYNGLDITYGVNFFKYGSPEPQCTDCDPCAGWHYCGDVNASCNYNGLDITYGVNYFKYGSPAPEPCADCPPIN